MINSNVEKELSPPNRIENLRKHYRFWRQMYGPVKSVHLSLSTLTKHKKNIKNKLAPGTPWQEHQEQKMDN